MKKRSVQWYLDEAKEMQQKFAEFFIVKETDEKFNGRVQRLLGPSDPQHSANRGTEIAERVYDFYQEFKLGSKKTENVIGGANRCL